MNVLETIRTIQLVPLIVLDDAKDAPCFAQALVNGGIPIAEVTFRTAAAEETIRKMSSEVPDILVGAGTVHTCEQAQTAVNAGAQFIVTPGMNPAVVRWCQEHEVAVIPGTVTPADLEVALQLGLSVCKFFPAEAYGGVKTLKALAGPYAEISFMPTGGVNEANMNDYLSLANVIAVGGSFMAPDARVKGKRWNEINTLCESIKKAIV